MKNVFTIVALFFMLLGGYAAKASNVLGAEITYKHVAGDSFDITLKVYRDCNGVTVSNAPLTVKSKSKSVNYALTKISSKDITGMGPNCGDSRCSGSYAYGIEEHIFFGRVLIGGDSSACVYTLSWEQCCRNGAITTGAASQNFYVESVIDKCAAPKNSSPVFSFYPRVLLPVGQDAHLSFKTTEPDGDMLTYQLVDPLIAAGSPQAYTGNYSSQKPVNFLGFPNVGLSFPAGFHVDSTAGDVLFRPTKQNEVSVLVMKVTEWRMISGKMTKIGEISRDIEVIIISAPNNKSPNFSQTSAYPVNPSTQNSQIPFCGNPGTFCIDIPVADADGSDTLSFAYDHKLDSISFTNIGTVTKPVIRACVTFTQAEINSGKPLLFTITAVDNACPLPGLVMRSFEYVVTPHMPDSFSIDKTLACRNLTAQINNKSASGSVYAWFDVKSAGATFHDSNIKTFIIPNLPDSGWYSIKMKVVSKDYCDTRTYTDSIFMPGANLFSFTITGNTLICNSPNTTTLTANTLRGTPPFTYLWRGPQSATTPSINITANVGKQKYYIDVTDSNMCQAKDSIEVKYYDPKVVISGDSMVCKGKTATLAATLVNTTSKPLYAWTGYPLQQNTINPLLTANTTFTFNLTDSSGCVVTKTHTVKASGPDITLTHKKNYCVNDSITLSANGSGSVAPYYIYWNSSTTANNSVILAPQSTAGNFNFNALVKDNNGCTKTVNDFVVINPLPTVSITSPGPFCKDKGSVNLASYGSPAGGTWSGTSVSGNNFNTSTGAGTYTLQYSYTSTAGCSAAQTTPVTVDEKPAANFSASSVTGSKPATIQFFNNTTNAGTATTWQWLVKDKTGAVVFTSTQKDPIYIFTSLGTYSITLIAINGTCNDTIEKANYISITNVGIAEINGSHIKVYPNPAKDRVIAEGDDIRSAKLFDMQGREIKTELTATGNLTYEIQFGPLSARVYLLHITNAAGTPFVQKLKVE